MFYGNYIEVNPIIERNIIFCHTTMKCSQIFDPAIRFIFKFEPFSPFLIFFAAFAKIV
jgi:hypothetical protein